MSEHAHPADRTATRPAFSVRGVVERRQLDDDTTDPTDHLPSIPVLEHPTDHDDDWLEQLRGALAEPIEDGHRDEPRRDFTPEVIDLVPDPAPAAPAPTRDVGARAVLARIDALDDAVRSLTEKVDALAARLDDLPPAPDHDALAADITAQVSAEVRRLLDDRQIKLSFGRKR